MSIRRPSGGPQRRFWPAVSRWLRKAAAAPIVTITGPRTPKEDSSRVDNGVRPMVFVSLSGTHEDDPAGKYSRCENRIGQEHDQADCGQHKHKPVATPPWRSPPLSGFSHIVAC